MVLHSHALNWEFYFGDGSPRHLQAVNLACRRQRACADLLFSMSRRCFRVDPSVPALEPVVEASSDSSSQALLITFQVVLHPSELVLRRLRLKFGSKPSASQKLMQAEPNKAPASTSFFPIGEALCKPLKWLFRFVPIRSIQQ